MWQEKELADFLKALGVSLAYMRIRKGMKQKDVAEKVGISSSYLSQVERGKRSASFKTLAKIAGVIGLKFHDLLRLTLDILDEER
jgi:transcriptional regulator with XRE-family HTH domain